MSVVINELITRQRIFTFSNYTLETNIKSMLVIVKSEALRTLLHSNGFCRTGEVVQGI